MSRASNWRELDVEARTATLPPGWLPTGGAAFSPHMFRRDEAIHGARVWETALGGWAWWLTGPSPGARQDVGAMDLQDALDAADRALLEVV